MSRNYAALDSNILGYAVRPSENIYSYWEQQPGQALAPSQGELLPLNAYVPPSSHFAHPPELRRLVPFSSPTATSESLFPLYSRRPDISNGTISAGTPYQEENDEINSSELQPRYPNFPNHALPSTSPTANDTHVNSPIGYYGPSIFRQSPSRGSGAGRRISNPNGSFTSDQAFAGHDLVHGSQCSPSPSPSQSQHDASGHGQHIPAPAHPFAQIVWQPSTDLTTTKARFNGAHNPIQFEHTFATTCNDQIHPSSPNGTSLSGTPGYTKPSPAKRRRIVSASEAAETSTVPRRQGATAFKSNIRSPKTRNILQGNSREDSFNVHVFHQVEGQPPRTTRSTFEPERRLEVARIREAKACFECRFSKQRVG